MIFKCQSGKQNCLSYIRQHCYPDEKINVWALSNQFSPHLVGVHCAYNTKKEQVTLYYEDGVLSKSDRPSQFKSYVVGRFLTRGQKTYFLGFPVICPSVFYLLLIACLLTWGLWPLMIYPIFLVWNLVTDLKKVYRLIKTACEA